jgi:hypothetical protein
MCDIVLKITEVIPKQTPERTEIALQFSMGFLIKLWLKDSQILTNG